MTSEKRWLMKTLFQCQEAHLLLLKSLSCAVHLVVQNLQQQGHLACQLFCNKGPFDQGSCGNVLGIAFREMLPKMCNSLKRLSEMMQSSKARLRMAPSFLKARFDCSAEDWWDSPVQGCNLTVELFDIFGKTMIFWIKTVVGPETEYAVEILTQQMINNQTNQKFPW